MNTEDMIMQELAKDPNSWVHSINNVEYRKVSRKSQSGDMEYGFQQILHYGDSPTSLKVRGRYGNTIKYTKDVKQTAIQDEAWIGEEMHRDAIMYFHQEMEEKFAKTPFENSQMSPSEYDAWKSKKDDWQRENLTREKIDTFHKDWIYRKENNLEQKKGVFERE